LTTTGLVGIVMNPDIEFLQDFNQTEPAFRIELINKTRNKNVRLHRSLFDNFERKSKIFSGQAIAASFQGKREKASLTLIDTPEEI